MSRYAVLIGEIEHDLIDLQALVAQTAALMQKVETTGDKDYLGTVALNLHGFYSGTERIFRDVALIVDEVLPEGGEWHRRLLRQMATAVPDTRPAVLSKPTLRVLSELCAFRHVVRNVYTFELIPQRVTELAHQLPDVCHALETDLQSFCQFLSRINGQG